MIRQTWFAKAGWSIEFWNSRQDLLVGFIIGQQWQRKLN
jgi:hypothetical protein